MQMILFVLLTESEKEEINRLLPLVAALDENALRSLYNAVGGRLLSLAVGVTRSLPLAEDALSESFIKVVRHAHSFKGGNGYAWLCTLVKNTALNMLKSERKKQGADIDSFFNLSDGRDFTKESHNAIMVEDALKRLRKDERLCIWLKYFNDYTVREIAAETGISKSSVQDLIKRAEQKLREFME